MRSATVYNFLLEANIMAGIAILLMLPIRRFLRSQLSSRVICVLWLLVAARLLCPLALPNPAINSIRSPFAMDQAIRPIAGQVKVRLSDATEALMSSAPDGSTLKRLLGELLDGFFSGMLAIDLIQLYLTGAAVVACWFIVSNLRFRRRLRAGRVGPVAGQLREQYEALCREFGLRPVPVYFTDPLPSACLVGVFRPHIVPPLTVPPAEAVGVFRHELCHLRRHDHWWALVRLVCCAVHWFNPLVWLAASLSRTDGELACDEGVTSGMSPQERKAYASVLVLAASRRDTPGTGVLATGMTMAGSRLKMRVASIVRGAHARRGLAADVVLLASIALVGAFATGEYLPVPAIPAASQAPPPQALEDADAAVAYAMALWQSDDLGQDTGGFAFTAARTEEGGWLVHGSDGEEELSLCVDKDGSLVFLQNGEVVRGYDVALPGGTPDHHDEAWYARLTDYLLSFAARVEPDMAGQMEDAQYSSEGVNPNGRRYVRAIGVDGRGMLLRLFLVQVEPVMRIVSYSQAV